MDCDSRIKKASTTDIHSRLRRLLSFQTNLRTSAPLRATLRSSTDVAQVAVAGSHCDRSADVAAGCVGLELGELGAAVADDRQFVFDRRHGSLCNRWADRLHGFMAVGAVTRAVGGTIRSVLRCSVGGSIPGARPGGHLGAGRSLGFLISLETCRRLLTEAPVLLSEPFEEGDAEPAEDVIDHALGDADVGVRRVAHRLEAGVRELLHEHVERHAVLEIDRDRRSEGVHQTADR